MPCTSCEKDIAPGARFCPYCRAEQTVSARTTTAAREEPEEGEGAATGVVLCGRCATPNWVGAAKCGSCGSRLVMHDATVDNAAPEMTHAAVHSRPEPQSGASAPSSSSSAPASEVLVLRAGENVWHFEEEEGRVQPGQRRPLLILDEQSVHLSHTDRRLEPETLLRRVQSILGKQGVPVSVTLIPTRWLRDGRETRPRLVAWLPGHPYGDIKLLLGVDYLGSWASIQMHVGVEPEALPPGPPPAPGWTPPWDGILAIIGGVLLLMVLIGIFPLAYGIWRLVTSKKKFDAKQIEDGVRRQQEQAQRERKRAMERMSRTFKVDDMRLFCSAMKSVFQTVVDDIVEQGGEVTRIEGGQGGFFQTEGLAQVGTPIHRTDAAELGV